MSSDESEVFDFGNVSGSEDSEGYVPQSKKNAKAKATPKAASKPKAATKPKLAAKKKVLKDHDDNAMEVDEDSDGDVRPAPAAGAESSRKKKTVTEKYTKLSQVEHILQRADTYIGSLEKHTQQMWVFDSDTKRMVQREITYVPGFFKIVDEILVNAADNKVNDPNMDTLKVDIDEENGSISVFNNGKGIEIEIHEEEGIYIPELIFGHLLSSSNYDDDEKKLTGGRNGLGAKLSNIYSHEFTVETADKGTEKKYKQTWSENMGKCGKAKITSNGKKEEYTRVSFRPDLARFHMDSIDPDTVSLLKKRVYDLAGTTKDVKVYLNGERLKVKGFKQYVDMYMESAAAEAAEAADGAASPKQTALYERIGDRWEVAFAVSDGTFQQVSFANSIATTKGGTHVNAIADQIAKNLTTTITKKNKGATVKAGQIKAHMWLFVNALVENPAFDSQTKENLTLPANKFGTKPVLSEEFMKKVMKTTIVDHVLNWAKFKADQQSKKTDGTKRQRLTGLTKLSDANNAGTRKSADCTLILTEGDSAKALAVAGLGVVGRDNFGVFPLRGKLLNVREAKHDQIMKNEEIQNIKKIVGLQHGKTYTSVDGLRYGSIMIMTDQDHDGSHIKGLLINFLDHFYPSLLKLPGFLVEFVTPIVRVTKGNQKINFFTIPEYEQWLEACPDQHRWTTKYYKGLGTSKDTDARDYFNHMEKHMIRFATIEEDDKGLIDLAFSKKKADDRKEWLREFKPGTFLNHDMDEIPYSDFINKELILFSMADNIRSIPSVADGLKPGQRKVIWGCFRQKLTKEVKVATLVGYVSQHSAYHHGEQSLMMTIINLAQDYVGSNNINLLMPNGQYGTRDQGGKDHASPRYIFTELAPITRTLFHPHDDALLSYLQDDNISIEPQWYLPILPMVLINGAEGIGTGWSTSIPSYNPVDIVSNVRRLMKGQEMEAMMPWWRGFKGTIKKTGDNKYEATGIAQKKSDTVVDILELPIHMWTQTYKAELEKMMGEKGDGPVKDFREHHSNADVHFSVTMSAAGMAKAEEQGFQEYFKLTSKISTANMVCFDFDNKIKKYKSPEEIIQDFYPVRLGYYQKRKDHISNELQTQLEKLNNQARFVQMIVDKQLVVANRKKAVIVAELRSLNFRPFPKPAKAKAAGEIEPVVEDEDEEDTPTTAGPNPSDYDYLLGMPIYNLTHEKIEKLKKQAADKDAELMIHLKLTPIEMWDTDLDKFVVDWETTMKDWEESAVVDSSGKKVKKKNAKLRTRDSLGGTRRRDDDDDDEFEYKPKKTTARTAGKKEVGSSKLAPLAKVVGKAAAPKDEEDDEDEMIPAPKKRVASETLRKAKAAFGSDEDGEEMPPPPPPAAKPKSRVASQTRKPTKPPTDDSDVEVVERRPKVVKTKASKKDESSDDDFAIKSSLAKGKGKAAAKRKSLDREGNDSDEEMYTMPAKKKKASPPVPQAHLEDFFDEPPSAPPAAKKPSPKKIHGMKGKSAPTKKAAPAKKKVESDEDDDEDMAELDDSPVAPRAAPRRAKAAAKPAYVEISDDDD